MLWSTLRCYSMQKGVEKGTVPISTFPHFQHRRTIRLGKYSIFVYSVSVLSLFFCSKSSLQGAESAKGGTGRWGGSRKICEYHSHGAMEGKTQTHDKVMFQFVCPKRDPHFKDEPKLSVGLTNLNANNVSIELIVKKNGYYDISKVYSLSEILKIMEINGYFEMETKD